MPQLNFADYPPQLVWLAITFILLYLVMARVAIPRITQVLEERQNRVAHDVSEAERLKKDTDKAIAEYEAALAEARSKASTIGADLRAELAAQDAERTASIDEQIAADMQKAEKRIAAAKADALGNIGEIAGDGAREVVRKIIGVEAGEDRVAAALQAELQESR
ncbi:F0F1 ATP synthase subunit B family protein [Oceanibacterium hippocampi]|uniref:ATP synthase subunit b n=1 Tax=Oceanibacterium hippocampi TaxID=745714 RepID=A0A1Y5S6Y6_9PROT|nr:hypothetical protein [Oceanibacterium hippocampi]SLN33856.1 ATP synthase subunit b 2 [Oceanibacterium hippocampi]